MPRTTAPGASLLTAVGVVGALLLSIGTVAAMATRTMSGASGVRVLALAAVPLCTLFSCARVLERRASRRRQQTESATPAI